LQRERTTLFSQKDRPHVTAEVIDLIGYRANFDLAAQTECVDHLAD